jgi:phage/plasmid-like protein (TIGR03299 family)
MAHEIDTSNNRQNMAFVGQTPWHGLGSQLPAGADIETWRTAAGLAWDVAETEVLFLDRGETRPFPDTKILLRSDTRAPLSVVSKWYNTVQPGEVLGFFDDLVKAGGFELETAGALRGGKRIWALARVGEEAKIVDGDMIKPYLLLATSYDASMCTTAQFTSVRVVCNNTLSAAIGNGEQKVKIPHLSKFDAKAVRNQLTIAVSSWDDFLIQARRMAATPLDAQAADAYLMDVFKVDVETLEAPEKTRKSKAYKRILELFDGSAVGSEIVGQSLWGAVNAVTEYVDHDRGKQRETALDAAWFGEGANLKDRAFTVARELIAA